MRTKVSPCHEFRQTCLNHLLKSKFSLVCIFLGAHKPYILLMKSWLILICECHVAIRSFWCKILCLYLGFLTRNFLVNFVLNIFLISLLQDWLFSLFVWRNWFTYSAITANVVSIFFWLYYLVKLVLFDIWWNLFIYTCLSYDFLIFEIYFESHFGQLWWISFINLCDHGDVHLRSSKMSKLCIFKHCLELYIMMKILGIFCKTVFLFCLFRINDTNYECIRVLTSFIWRQ